ncbi:dUTP diphosphatase [Xylocopilactobacillus apicola]|uniref:dUTP diphosphatase n=1 Tax=Xylocopilactobacillus apicola TaxID=2932184 RepID=A0AAU9DDJ2_9LACO|nr:dUTP diphosphatase [Xylocopilactobacillus apicola]BDR58892.1 dUTP diphosphatase [Xylocopilactobacillus apicola]
MRGFKIVSKYQGQEINLPERQSSGSAGYDFEAAEDLIIKAHQARPELIPTGIKAYMPDNEFLMLVNRSGNPKKKGLVMPNGVGIVDSDYFDNPGNEGEIFFQVINIRDDDILVKKGERIGQGIFMPFLMAEGDEAIGQRIGGFGSSGD